MVFTHFELPVYRSVNDLRLFFYWFLLLASGRRELAADDQPPGGFGQFGGGAGRDLAAERRLHGVELPDVGHLEGQRLFAGEPHGQEHEAVPGEVERAVKATLDDRVWRLNLLKPCMVQIWTAEEVVDVAKHVLVLLPEEVGDIRAGGEHGTVAGEHDGEAGGGAGSGSASVQAALPGVNPALVRMMADAPAGACGRCYSFEAGQCTARGLATRAEEPGCIMYEARGQ